MVVVVDNWGEMLDEMRCRWGSSFVLVLLVVD